MVYLGAVEQGAGAIGIGDVKEFSGKELKTPRGSLRSFMVPLPVLMTVAVTLRFWTPSTSTLGVEVLTVKPGAALTATAEATRTVRAARREESMAVWAVKAAGETTV